MLILICDPDQLRAKIWASALISELNVQVHITRDMQNAIAYIQTFPTLDLIIAPTETPSVEIAPLLIKKSRELSKSLKLLFFGKNEVKGPLIYFLNREPLIKTLISKIQEIIGTIEHSPDYIPVPLVLLNSNQPSPCSFYLRLSKNTFDHMTLFSNPGDTLSKEQLDKLKTKKCNEVWIKTESKNIFYNQYLKLLEAEFFYESKESTVEEISARCSDFVINSVIEFGIAPESAQKLLTQILHESKQGKDDSNISEHIRKNLFSSFSLKSIHPTMTALIAMHYLAKQSWFNPSHLGSIVLAANMMDMDLLDDREILIRSQSEFDQLNLKRAEKFRIIHHAEKACEFLAQNKKTPNTALNLIKAHHGSHHGRGFNEGPVTKLDKINLLFIFAEELSCYLYVNRNHAWTKKNFLDSIESRFPDHQFLQELLNS